MKAFQPIVNYNISVQNITINQNRAPASADKHKEDATTTKGHQKEMQVDENNIKDDDDDIMAKFFYENSGSGGLAGAGGGGDRPCSAMTSAYGNFKMQSSRRNSNNDGRKTVSVRGAYQSTFDKQQQNNGNQSLDRNSSVLGGVSEFDEGNTSSLHNYNNYYNRESVTAIQAFNNDDDNEPDLEVQKIMSKANHQ